MQASPGPCKQGTVYFRAACPDDQYHRDTAGRARMSCASGFRGTRAPAPRRLSTESNLRGGPRDRSRSPTTVCDAGRAFLARLVEQHSVGSDSDCLTADLLQVFTWNGVGGDALNSS